MQRTSVRALTDLAAMAALAPEDRATVAKDLVVHLGADWAADGDPGDTGDGVGLRHLPTGLAFVAVDGSGGVTARRHFDRDATYDRAQAEEAAARHGFGVEGLFCRQWLADDWHPSYEGAPDTSEPWLDGDPQGVRRGDGESTGIDFNWQHVAHESFHHLLAALREPGGTPLTYCERENRVGLRFAAPLALG